MKFIKFLIKFALVVIILVVAACGIVVYQLNDSSFSEPDYINTLEPLKLDGNTLLSKGLENCEEEDVITINLDERDVNSIFKSLKDTWNEKLKPTGVTIRTMYVDIDDSHDIEFISYFDVKGFKTSIKGDFHIEFNNGLFEMMVKDIEIGKMEFKNAFVTKLINNFANNINLKNELNVSGITVVADLSTLTISFDLKELKGLISSNNSESSLYTTLVDVLFRVEDLITLSEVDDNMGIALNIKEFEYKEERDNALPYNVDFNSVNDKIETLLNSNVITKENANKVATYLAKGYFTSPSEVQDFVKPLDLTSVGIENNETYLGIIPFDINCFEENLVSQLPSISEIANFKGFKLSEDSWNNFFAKSLGVGEIYTFVREENGRFESTYIAVESLYIDIKNDEFALYLTVLLNGERVVVCLDLTAPSSESWVIHSTVNTMRMGNQSLLENEIKSILKFLETAIQDDWFVINSEESRIDFDFALLFSGDEDLSAVLSLLTNVSASFVEEDNVRYTFISAGYSI